MNLAKGQRPQFIFQSLRISVFLKSGYFGVFPFFFLCPPHHPPSLPCHHFSPFSTPLLPSTHLLLFFSVRTRACVNVYARAHSIRRKPFHRRNIKSLQVQKICQGGQFSRIHQYLKPFTLRPSGMNTQRRESICKDGK